MVYHPKRLPRNSLALIYKRAEGDTRKAFSMWYSNPFRGWYKRARWLGRTLTLKRPLKLGKCAIRFT